MPTDATGTPTSLGIPTYNVDADAPSGLGFNEAMAVIDALLVARTVSITSVFGRTGAVVPQTGDYTAAEVSGAADKSSGSDQVFAGAVDTPTLKISGSPIAAANVVGAADKSSASAQAFTAMIEAPDFFPSADTSSSFALSGTMTPNPNTAQFWCVTCTAGGGTLTVANPSTSGPPNINTMSGFLIIEIVNGAATNSEAISWGTLYQFSAVPKPTTIAAGQRMILLFVWEPQSHGWYAVGKF